MRGGVQFQSDNDAKTSNYGSRWGIKGESEAGEGLTAVYKLETRIGSSATQSANQLYVGLSGGFGNVTLGKIVGAVNNHSGAPRNQAYWESGSDTLLGGRYEALSYAISAGSVSAQIDLVMDGATDTGSSIDASAFGMTAALGDLGKVSIGYENKKDTMKSTMYRTTVGEGDAAMTHNDLTMISVSTRAGQVDKDGNLIAGAEDANLISIIKANGKYSNGGATGCDAEPEEGADRTTPDDTTDDCATGIAYVRSETTNNGEEATTDSTQVVSDETTETYFAAAKVDAPTTIVDVYGAKKTHVSAEFGLGAVTLGLGHSQKESNKPGTTGKTKINYLGLQGSLGDTGLNWLAWGRSVEAPDGTKTNPWMVGINKSLGGGAFTFVEHTNADDDSGGTTHVAFGVNF